MNESADTAANHPSVLSDTASAWILTRLRFRHAEEVEGHSRAQTAVAP